MEHVSVASSQIASIAFDPRSATMQVLFRRGGLYEYSDVSRDEFEQVLQPSDEHKGSVGTAFGSVIKGRKTSRKLEGAATATPSEKAPDPATTSTGPAPEAPLPAEAQQVKAKSTDLVTQAEAIEVTTAERQEQASAALLAIALVHTEICETFRRMKDAAYKAHKVICDQERALLAPLVAAERLLKSRIGDFVAEQTRLAREAEEAARKAERERADAEAVIASQNRALQQAIELEARGNLEAAEAVLANPAPVTPRYVAPAPVAPAVAQVKGVSTRTEWDFKIVDFDKIPREYLLVNETAIRNAGKNTKGRIRIAGVEFFEKTVVAASRRG